MTRFPAFSRWRRQECGATALEFAIVAAVFVTVSIGIIEFGRALMVRNEMAYAIDRGYGSTLALPVWVEVMKTAEKLKYKAEGLKSQLSFRECRLCRTTGLCGKH